LKLIRWGSPVSVDFFLFPLLYKYLHLLRGGPIVFSLYSSSTNSDIPYSRHITMKYTLVALTALASALIPGAAAADIPSIGECQALVDLVLPCAVEPINDAIVAVGCTRGDYTCACPKYAELLGLAFDGVVAGCGGALQGLPAAEQAQNACNCILALPPPVAGTTTTTAAAPTGTAPPSECQDLIDQVLPCAVDPINDAIEAIGCTRGDYLCACPKYDELLGLAFDGVVAGCGGALEGLPAAEQAQNVCKCLLPAGGTSSSSSSSSVITTTATATDTNTATATDTNTTTATAQPSSCTTVLPPTTPEDNSCAAQIAAVPECAKKCIDDVSYFPLSKLFQHPLCAISPRPPPSSRHPHSSSY
jgi:hypothetical protein